MKESKLPAALEIFLRTLNTNPQKMNKRFVEGRITTLENMIRFAEIIDNEGVDNDEVSIGKTVTFIELPDGDEEEYTIVGSAEADPFSGKISNDSPIARALIGKNQ